jgi:hypothetical protein
MAGCSHHGLLLLHTHTSTGQCWELAYKLGIEGILACRLPHGTQQDRYFMITTIPAQGYPSACRETDKSMLL